MKRPESTLKTLEQFDTKSIGYYGLNMEEERAVYEKNRGAIFDFGYDMFVLGFIKGQRAPKKATGWRITPKGRETFRLLCAGA